MTDNQGLRLSEVADPGVQQERTALAWERTAIATMVAGVLVSRVASEHHLWLVATFGLFYVAAGGLTLIWTSQHYNDLHAPLASGADVVHPVAARVVGLTTISLTIIAFALALLLIIEEG